MRLAAVALLGLLSMPVVAQEESTLQTTLREAFGITKYADKSGKWVGDTFIWSNGKSASEQQTLIEGIEEESEFLPYDNRDQLFWTALTWNTELLTEETTREQFDTYVTSLSAALELPYDGSNVLDEMHARGEEHLKIARLQKIESLDDYLGYADGENTHTYSMYTVAVTEYFTIAGRFIDVEETRDRWTRILNTQLQDGLFDLYSGRITRENFWTQGGAGDLSCVTSLAELHTTKHYAETIDYALTLFENAMIEHDELLEEGETKSAKERLQTAENLFLWTNRLTELLAIPTSRRPTDYRWGAIAGALETFSGRPWDDEVDIAQFRNHATQIRALLPYTSLDD